MIVRKTEAELETMARAGRVVADTLDMLEREARPGVTTGELDRLAEEFITSRGGVPTFKGYKGYPAATCLSPNATRKLKLVTSPKSLVPRVKPPESEISK